MSIPSQEELEMACDIATQMAMDLRRIRELLGVAKNRGVRVNGLKVPLTDDLIQPLIDEYQAAKTSLANSFQELP